METGGSEVRDGGRTCPGIRCLSVFVCLRRNRRYVFLSLDLLSNSLVDPVRLRVQSPARRRGEVGASRGGRSGRSGLQSGKRFGRSGRVGTHSIGRKG